MLKDIQLGVDEVLNDLQGFKFRIPPKEITGNPFMREIKRVGREKKLTFSLWWSPQHERYFLMVENIHHIKTLFCWVETLSKGFRPVDSRLVLEVRKTLNFFKNQKNYYKELRAKREELLLRKDENSIKEFNYQCAQNQRLFRRVSRVLGYTSGKTNLPF